MDPTWIPIHLGFLWDTLEGTVALPEDRTTRVETWNKKLLVLESSTQEDLESLVGTLISTNTAVWKAPLHLRYLHRTLLFFHHLNLYSTSGLMPALLKLFLKQEQGCQLNSGLRKHSRAQSLGSVPVGIYGYLTNATIHIRCFFVFPEVMCHIQLFESRKWALGISPLIPDQILKSLDQGVSLWTRFGN